MTIVKIDKRGRLTIPKAMRDELGWKTGTRLRLRVVYPTNVNQQWQIVLRAEEVA